jgi:phage baseplate assembly protein W
MTRNTRTYTDLDAAFTLNPRTRDVAVKIDEAAVRNSIRNLIHTKNYERPFQPSLGCQVHGLLFENLTPLTINVAERTIWQVLNKYEPRIEILSIDVAAGADDISMNVEVIYRILNTNQPLRFNTTFTRVR